MPETLSSETAFACSSFYGEFENKEQTRTVKSLEIAKDQPKNVHPIFVRSEN
jgi:hypothetical protein